MDEKGVIGDCSHDFSEIFGALAGSKVGDTFVLLDHEMDFAQMLKQQSLVKMQDCALGITLKGRFTPMRDQYLFAGHLVLPDHLYDWVEQPSSFDNEFTPNINAYFQTFDEDEPYVFEGQNVRASEILSISKFPSENPNPVYRVSCKGKLLYANDACLQLLCRPVASQFKLHEKLIAVHQENVERRTGTIKEYY